MKTYIKLAGAVLLPFSLSGCAGLAAPIIASAIAPLMAQKLLTKQAETKPPQYIDITQEGRIITASFEAKGIIIGQNQAAQIKGFHQWATAAVVKEASKRGCVNVEGVMSAAGGVQTNSSLSSTSMATSARFKCLEEESEYTNVETLEDKQIIYADYIAYIKENPGMIRYVD